MQPSACSHCRKRCALAAGPSLGRPRAARCWALTAPDMAAAPSDSCSSSAGICAAAAACQHAAVEVSYCQHAHGTSTMECTYLMLLSRCQALHMSQLKCKIFVPTCHSSARQQAAPTACTATAGVS